MGIRRFGDYDKTRSYGEYQVLPRDGYVIRILGASVHENSNGQYIKTAADVAEGEYQGFYNRDYQNQQSEDRKWRCNYLLSVPNDDGSEKDGWTKRRFKTFTESLEESNPGYHFDWDESKFKGLIIVDFSTSVSMRRTTEVSVVLRTLHRYAVLAQCAAESIKFRMTACLREDPDLSLEAHRLMNMVSCRFRTAQKSCRLINERA